MTKKTSRKDEVIAMLKRSNGATTAQIMERTKMLEHSARALISGIGKDHTVTKLKSGDKPTVYKIEASSTAKAA